MELINNIVKTLKDDLSVKIKDGRKLPIAIVVFLKQKVYASKMISTLSKLIPQNVLFVFEYENESRFVIYHTKVMPDSVDADRRKKVELKGLNLDTVWENIVIDVGGVNIEKGNMLDEQIEINEKSRSSKKKLQNLKSRQEQRNSLKRNLN